MRYTEPRERSAELLRAALAQMGRHDAAFNPITFAVWYEHTAGINTRLTRALDECLRAEPRLSDQIMARLYREFVSEVDEISMERASGELQRLMAGMAETAAHTGSQAGTFGDQLTGLTEALHGNKPDTLAPLLSQAVVGTAQMRASAAALQQQVEKGRREIDRLRDDLSRARDEALIDPLSRVLNRKGFDQRVQALLDTPVTPGRAHCVVMLDIDRFKQVNDTHGHVMGDRILQAVAEVMRSTVTDPSHSVARYGGEEFAILMPQSTLDSAAAAAELIRHRVGDMKVRDRRTQHVVLTVTISGGVAAMAVGDDASSLVARADELLYAAKAAGRDRVHRA
jgi:diguanylate cyclase